MKSCLVQQSWQGLCFMHKTLGICLGVLDLNWTLLFLWIHLRLWPLLPLQPLTAPLVTTALSVLLHTVKVPSRLHPHLPQTPPSLTKLVESSKTCT